MSLPTSAVKRLAMSQLAAYGWTSQFGCLDYIYFHESGWRWNALNPDGITYGIPQANPGTKMASAGADWRTNPATQIKWGLHYILKAYGSPCQAQAFWVVHHWY